MPKIKSKRAAIKRFRTTKTGKVKVMSSGKSHLLRNKTQKQKRRLRKIKYAHPTMMSRMNRLMPNGAAK